MKFTIIVNNAPYQSQSSDTAYQFTSALLAAGHELVQVFFYSDGVLNALKGAEPPQDDRNVTANWSALAMKHQVELIVCSTAGNRRGVVGELAAGFKLDTLGRLSEAVTKAERVVSFGT